MKFKVAVALLAVLGLMLVTQAAAQPGGGTRTILGQVLGPDKLPVAEAQVHLKDLQRGTGLTVVTDKEGRYLFAGLPRDTDLEISAEFQELRSRSKRVSRFDRRTRIFLDFELKKPEKKSPEPAAKEGKPPR